MSKLPCVVLIKQVAKKLILFNRFIKSFDFILKSPPVAVQILEAAKLKKGSPEPNRNKVATISWAQVQSIAEAKMKDLNAFTVTSAMHMVAGTARSMGVKVKGKFPDEIN